MQSSFKRGIIVWIGFILQITLTVLVYRYLVGYLKIIELLYSGLSLIIVLYIIKNSTRLSKDVPWIILILLFPIFGTVFYITLGRNYSRNKLLRRIFKVEDEYDSFLVLSLLLSLILPPPYEILTLGSTTA